MKQYQLPLTRDYVRSWTSIEAIREILQNAIDYGQGKLDAVIFRNDEDSNTLTVFSAGASLEPKTLLLGCTSKAEDDDSIGSFGEGYKIALLVLAREGIEVEVRNAGLIWTPSFAHSDTFQSEVLCINESCDDCHPNGLMFIIRGLSNATIETVVENTLQLQECIGKFHRVEQGDILLERAGKLFINGLFVTETGLEFGYDVKPKYLALERDRQTVSTWDMKFLTKDMWFETGLFTEIAAMLERGCDDLEYGNYGCPELVKEACYKAFITKHPTAVVARSQHELESIVKKGITNEVVIYRDAYASIVSGHDDYSKNINQITILSPLAELEQFFKDNRNKMRKDAVVKFKKLIEKSRKWKV